MSFRPLVVTAHLAGPLAGEAPRLDALLEYALAQHLRKPVDRAKVDRALPAPPQGAIPIPLGKAWVGPWLVYQCSDPVLPRPAQESVSHYNKRIDTGHARLLDASERRILSTTNSWTKSYRLPLRIRPVACVRWAAFGDRRELLKLLTRILHVGKKVSYGYGRVERWTAEDTDADVSWFAKAPTGPVLMRTLPLMANGREWLPRDLLGARRDYGAVGPPYWHRDRYAEVVVPC